jgi:pimeloyl-ACP methyl ester carboxylesterase
MTAPAPKLVGDGLIRVIVSHGWIADHTLFDPFAAAIDRRRFTYAFPDCRGYGKRIDEPGPMTVEAMAADVLAVADRLGWRRFHVIGHSMGGMAAQRLLIDAPERLASALLLAPVPACGARLDPVRRILVECAIAEPEARRALIAANTGGRQPPEWVERILQLSWRTTSDRALSAYLDSWSATDFSREIRKVTVPVHVVLGELDPGASLARMEETILRWFPHATCEQLPRAGHYPMQEQPEELLRTVERHLESNAYG